ncbi:helix-turn-helix transcriptional regulator [Alkaliphilus peptidifermentans]|uniref:Predicted DNA-binding transcriptional regulator YafY, contains an HTH and WYL domains n=1 Tax=Alkaliphilus peptidifermentans DSM 18978 TaxID=1120976 RepID=A0A1G5LGQ1_9FIRM|nr:YafY family protein [Alkaliphilus peptidifermentans]SCZ11339.1 Predicted DNA-binding transcriptional regulator YafY, contains an HTH and WYL domains [Alkaliphilus peptidifermentans DSM 18978]
MQIERLFKIVYYLLDKKIVTAKELAGLLGVSKRTVFRDIDTLSLSGIPIYSEKGSKGGYKLTDSFVLNKSIITEHEQNEILSALQGLSAVKTEETEQVLQKLSTFFKKSPPNWFSVDFSSWGDGGGVRDFSDIKNAIFKKHIIEFDYYNSKGEKTHRRVEPLHMWFKAHSWYFNGFCLVKQGVRLFKLSRTRNFTVTDEKFTERDLLTESECHEQTDTFHDRVTLVMNIAPEMAYRVYDFYSEEDIVKNDDGSLTVTQRGEPEDNGMYGFILSFGEYAEVLEPKHIRDIINEKALLISKKYLK